MERWRNKIAVVTGASSGIGWAIVCELLAAGMHVVGLARRLERMQQSCAALSSAAERARFLPIRCDLSILANIQDAFRQIETTYDGRLHVLINNAGMSTCTQLLDANNEVALQRVMDINFMGTVHCTKQAFRLMQNTLKEEESVVQCHVINVCSLLGHTVPIHIPSGGYNLYPISKHAQRALNEVLRREFHAVDKQRLRLSTISPGLTDTEFGSTPSPNIGGSLLEAKDVARGISFILGSPAHVNIAELLMMPTCEAY